MLGKIKLCDIDTALAIDKQVCKYDPCTDPNVAYLLWGLPFELFNDDSYDVIRVERTAVRIYDNEGVQWYVPFYFVRSYIEEGSENEEK